MVIPYVYVTSQVFVIALLAYLLVEQLATSSYQSVLSRLTVGLSLTISVLIMASLAYTCLKAY